VGARAKATRNPAVTAHLPDGSYLARLDDMGVRMIDADVAMTGADGTAVADKHRLITTLTDHRAFPAASLVRLYHERWGIESAFLALRHTLLGGRVFRSGERPGVEQELWALLTLYQLLRMAMVTTVETRPGTDPDRASFTSALEAAREELTAARGVRPDGPADLPGVIGRAVLATLLPARRLRYSARKVKCATSRYLNRDDARPDTTTAITAIDITVRTPPLSRGRPAATSPPGPGRRSRPPAARRSPRSSPASPRATGHHANSPERSTSTPAPSPPSSGNGPCSASSPAPGWAPTGSTRRHRHHPRQPDPTLNYAALARDRLRRPLTRCPLTWILAPIGTTDRSRAARRGLAYHVLDKPTLPTRGLVKISWTGRSGRQPRPASDGRATACRALGRY
jgi:hypothetical protein